LAALIGEVVVFAEVAQVLFEFGVALFEAWPEAEAEAEVEVELMA